jgi:excisionase family DNA binding protein
MVETINVNSSSHFTINQVAAHLGVCKRTITRAINQGRLGCLRVGRRICIPAADLRAFINACRPA